VSSDLCLLRRIPLLLYPLCPGQYAIPDLDTFAALGRDQSKILYVSDAVFNDIPRGTRLRSVYTVVGNVTDSTRVSLSALF
jgi:hypothetical protein